MAKMLINLSARQEVLLGTAGLQMIKDRVKNVHLIEAARKPWPEKDGPWGDPDGDDKGAYEIPPGEVEERAPDGDRTDQPDIRAMDALCLRDLCLQFAEECPSDAGQALIAIEARLTEITRYMPQALGGLSGAARAKLAGFSASI